MAAGLGTTRPFIRQLVQPGVGMAIDSDYQILAQSLKQLVEQLARLSAEVEDRRAAELAADGDPNSSYWVNYLSVQLGMVRPALEHLEETTSRVLTSPRGVRVFG